MNRNVAALDFITECLRTKPSPERLDELRQQLDRMPLGWETMVEIANEEFVTAAVWRPLERCGVAERLPQDLQVYLSDIHRRNRVRNEQTRAQSDAIATPLDRAGISPVLLKGAAHLYTGTYDDPGARMMADLDLLVPESEIEIAWSALRELGYQPQPGPGIRYDIHHHLTPLRCEAEPALVELHRQVLFSDRSVVPLADAHASSVAVAAAPSLRVLSPTYRVLQNFWHSELDDEQYRRGNLSLKYLHELVRLEATYGDAIDWERIRALVAERGKSFILDAYLYRAHRLFGVGTSDRRLASWFHYSRCRTRVRWDWAWYVDQRIQGLHSRLERAFTGA